MTSVAIAYDMSTPLHITSDLLGPLTIEPDAVLTFPEGLLGFPECRSFVLLPSEREHVYWLQSIEYTALAFLMVDPFVFFEGYTVDLSNTDVAVSTETERIAPNELTVLAIVTLPADRGGKPTANLQGPVVFDMRAQQGRQVVIPESRYGIRESFVL